MKQHRDARIITSMVVSAFVALGLSAAFHQGREVGWEHPKQALSNVSAAVFGACFLAALGMGLAVLVAGVRRKS